MPPALNRSDEVLAAIRRCRLGFIGVGLFSGLINVLALSGALYMLQIYDRVLPSRSLPTLIGLTILLIGLYAVYGALDLFRVRILGRLGLRIDRALRERVFSSVLMSPLRRRPGGEGLQPVHDLDTIRNFLSGVGPTALFDLPWLPVYLMLIYIMHPLLGLLAAGGGLVLFALAVATDMKSRKPAQAAVRSGAARHMFGEAVRRNAEAVYAMGFDRQVIGHWLRLNSRHLSDQAAAAKASSGLSTISKIMRLLLQSFVLGLGAWLVIHDQATGGVMIAASILTSRALAPIEVAIANWRSLLGARHAMASLGRLFAALPRETTAIDLPRPVRSLAVQGLAVAAPGSEKPIIQNVTFALNAGAGLGVIGPSASGKSTLARAIVGAWRPLPQRGIVRMDDAALEQWNPSVLGRDIGYLPQDIELFDGTVAENIARFDAEATSAAVIAAAEAAGAHQMILHLSDGYETRIGEAGTALSAGQRQRVALARALYGDPFLVVLDEPNSNLDPAGDAALMQAIRSVRERRGIIVVIAHRPFVLAALDTVLVMGNGEMRAFGPRDEVMKPRVPPVPAGGPSAPAARNPLEFKVVGESGQGG